LGVTQVPIHAPRSLLKALGGKSKGRVEVNIKVGKVGMIDQAGKLTEVMMATKGEVIDQAALVPGTLPWRGNSQVAVTHAWDRAGKRTYLFKGFE
jgi:hypothetical protein